MTTDKNKVENVEGSSRNTVVENIRVESPGDWVRETTPGF
jgi:hypothetical protein